MFEYSYIPLEGKSMSHINNIELLIQNVTLGYNYNPSIQIRELFSYKIFSNIEMFFRSFKTGVSHNLEREHRIEENSKNFLEYHVERYVLEEIGPNCHNHKHFHLFSKYPTIVWFSPQFIHIFCREFWYNISLKVKSSTQ